MAEENINTSLTETQSANTLNDELHSSSSNSVPENPPTTNVAAQAETGVREIYKNSWLKHIPGTEKWSGRLYKYQRPEKYWVVFCIHDEKDAFIEFYENRRSAYSHVPLSSISLSQCLHISPTIVIQENDYEFVITLDTQVIKLAAASQEQMLEWMDTIRNKLRELGILDPKDNLYSKEPMTSPRSSMSNLPLSDSMVSLDSQNLNESRTSISSDRISLRDPTSPLPPVPMTTASHHSSSNSSQVFVRSLSFVQISTRSDHSQTPSTSEEITSTISTTASLTQDSLTEQTQNLSLNYSQSVPNTPTTVVSSLYEPLFHPSVTNPLTNVQNSSYENFIAPSLDNTPPVLPPRPVNDNAASGSRRRRTSASGALGHGSDNSNSSVQFLRRTSNDNISATWTRVPYRQNDTEDSSSSSATQSTSNHPFLTDENGGLLSLREAQVLKLQSEMNHKSGVRIILRKKDCINSIAFVESHSCVWIAGWKQKEHPLLYNAFHIGDCITSISGHRIQTIQDALKTIKLQHFNVEFIVRRVPFGKVLALKKEYEGQDLGIVREGGTAEIKEVKVGGLAARFGLTAKATASDGQGTCNWFLTEINQRPLNLFFKDNEINDRLNAIGLDISILVQPIDFVKSLKKQLKSIRGYKDYTLQ